LLYGVSKPSIEFKTILDHNLNFHSELSVPLEASTQVVASTVNTFKQEGVRFMTMVNEAAVTPSLLKQA
jgi:hypothetical protein